LNLHARNPIGIFDSGIGGLTVAAAIHKLLPNERIIYFGDTAHLPYGDKSAKSIKGYSEKITEFLLEKHCKMVVIACNTASSVGFKIVKQSCGSRALATNVIDPMVRYVSKQYETGKVGVIGTKGTIESRVYPRKLKQQNASLIVSSAATPLLCPMIEEGFFNNNISKTIIFDYLSRDQLDAIDALILGCTHYPLIKKEVESFYKKSVEVIDSSEIVARDVERLLGQKNLLAQKKPTTRNHFYVSDYTDSFEKSTRLFFKGEIHLKEANIWK
jgi:glutamate racemase